MSNTFKYNSSTFIALSSFCSSQMYSYWPVLN